MHGQSLRAAVSERIDFRRVIAPAGERVVRRHAAVIAQSQYLAAVIARLLRAVLLLPLAEGQEQEAVAVDRDAPAVVGGRLAPVVGDEDLLDVVEPRAV